MSSHIMVYLLTAFLLFGFVTGSKRIVKEIYQPFGPRLCRELSVDSTDSFRYTVERLCCRRIPENYPIILAGNNIPTTIASLAVPPRDGRIKTSPEAQTSSRHVIPNTATTLTSLWVMKARGTEDMSHTKIKRLQHESTTNKIFKHNPNVTLLKACELGKLDEVKFILSKELEDINCQYENGRTPVMAAAAKGHKPVFDFLISRGCDLSFVSTDNVNLLHIACEGGNTDIVKKLINEKDFDINGAGWTGWTPVMYAVHYGNTELADFLVHKGCNLTIVDVDGQNLLHAACIGGHVQTVKYILRNNLVSIDSRNHFGRTALMLAAGNGHVNVVALLVNNGFDVTVTDRQNNNMLHAACTGGHVDMVKYILKQNLSGIESRGLYGKTAVMLAAQLGHREVFDFLVGIGCNLQVTDLNKHSILHTACMGDHVDMVKYILTQNIVDIDSKADGGRTSIMISATEGHVGVYDLLVSKGCDLRLVDDLGNNVLHYACIGGDVNMVQHIIKQNIFDVNKGGRQDRTPVLIAAENGHREVFDFLVSKGCILKVADKCNNNILHLACIGGNVDMVKYIISQHIIDIESRGCFGKTAVMLAVEQGHQKVANLLVLKGCSLFVCDNCNNTILHIACLGGHEDMVKYIMSKNIVSMNVRGFRRRTPMMSAAVMGHVGVVDLLTSKGCDVKTVDVYGNNILHLACIAGQVDMVKYIISKNIVSVNVRGFSRRTPVMSAAVMGHARVVDLLMRKGCDWKAVDAYGNNILHLACIGGRVNIVRWVIKLGILSQKELNKHRMTPMQLAKKNGHLDVVALFKGRA